MFSPTTLDTLENWQQDFVQAAIAQGCEWVQTGYNSWALNTGPLYRPDCASSFNISLYGQPGDFGFFYVPADEPPERATHELNCGNVPNNVFDLDAMVYQAGVCPTCGEYVGIDNMKQVHWAGRACSNCAGDVQAEFDDYIRKYGTD